MESFSALLTGIAAISWPLIVIAAFLLFREPLTKIFESARTRKFSLKIGGQELTMEEASEQQRNLIVDLQNQLGELKRRFDQLVPDSTSVAERIPSEVNARLRAVLWVDDNPKNNSYFLERLHNLGIPTDLALSTREALTKLGKTRYDFIISDMARDEGAGLNETAGLELLQYVRRQNPDVPFVIYCGAAAARKYQASALEHGATAITASATELSSLLHLDEIEKRPS